MKTDASQSIIESKWSDLIFQTTSENIVLFSVNKKQARIIKAIFIIRSE